MERESFEDEAAAALLSAHFVAVKVDREERPDVDRVYVRPTRAFGPWALGGAFACTPFLEHLLLEVLPLHCFSWPTTRGLGPLPPPPFDTNH